MMSQETLFTQEELDDMGARTVDLVEGAVDRGDSETARRLARRLYREGMAIHDSYRDWVTGLLDFIGRQYGDEALNRALEQSVGAMVEDLLTMVEGADIRRRVRVIAGVLRQHGQPVRITEDEEKFVFRMEPCGSGGRQVLEGKYDPPHGYLRVRNPQPMTCGKEDFPVYCCHGHFFVGLPVKWGRPPAILEIPAEKLGEQPCEFWLYKDPAAIPLEAYRKAGVERPSLSG